MLSHIGTALWIVSVVSYYSHILRWIVGSGRSIVSLPIIRVWSVVNVEYVFSGMSGVKRLLVAFEMHVANIKTNIKNLTNNRFSLCDLIAPSVRRRCLIIVRTPQASELFQHEVVMTLAAFEQRSENVYGQKVVNPGRKKSIGQFFQTMAFERRIICTAGSRLLLWTVEVLLFSIRKWSSTISSPFCIDSVSNLSRFLSSGYSRFKPCRNGS